jgi:hypothetical protein
MKLEEPAYVGRPIHNSLLLLGLFFASYFRRFDLAKELNANS